MRLEYYRVTFYAGGVYLGEDAYLCRGMGHALRMAAYVKLAFARAACLELGIPFEPSRIAVDVFGAAHAETAANVNLATCVS